MADVNVYELRGHVEIALAVSIPKVYPLCLDDGCGVEGALGAPGVEVIFFVQLFHPFCINVQVFHDALPPIYASLSYAAPCGLHVFSYG